MQQVSQQNIDETLELSKIALEEYIYDKLSTLGFLADYSISQTSTSELVESDLTQSPDIGDDYSFFPDQNTILAKGGDLYKIS